MLRKAILGLAVLALAVSMSSARAGESARIVSHDGLLWADVECGGATLHFVVDTGAAVSCVNLAAAERLGMHFGSAINVAGVGGRAAGYRCGGFQASVGGMHLPEEVVALDLSGPARACSQPIDGLIGADFFRGRVVSIDYARGMLTRGDAPAAGGSPLRFANGVICAQVAVNGGTARWTRLDTGCTDALDWCPVGSPFSGFAIKSVALARSSQDALVADVAIGSTHLGEVPVRMRDQPIFPGEAGLLGNRILSKYRVTIDGIRRRLVLEPAA